MKELKQLIGNTDIYLLDQIMKDRYNKKDTILDAGCGKGRNLQWFYQNKFNIYAIDQEEKNIYQSRISFPRIKDNIFQLSIQELDELDMKFDHIICNAVLHFANSKEEFFLMFQSLWNSLEEGGTLFIRMTSDIGIETLVRPIKNGVYVIPDGSERFLWTDELSTELKLLIEFEYVEPIKTVQVNKLRSMTTLVLKKKNSNSSL